MGQKIQLLSSTHKSDLQKSLAESVNSGAKYALISIPEDIGLRANLGRSGAEKSGEAFLQFFLNMQCNRFLDASKFVLVGHIDLADIKAKEAQQATDGIASTSDLMARFAQTHRNRWRPSNLHQSLGRKNEAYHHWRYRLKYWARGWPKSFSDGSSADSSL